VKQRHLTNTAFHCMLRHFLVFQLSQNSAYKSEKGGDKQTCMLGECSHSLRCGTGPVTARMLLVQLQPSDRTSCNAIFRVKILPGTSLCAQVEAVYSYSSDVTFLPYCLDVVIIMVHVHTVAIVGLYAAKIWAGGYRLTDAPCVCNRRIICWPPWK
jgi:hypothetical protein